MKIIMAFVNLTGLLFWRSPLKMWYVLDDDIHELFRDVPMLTVSLADYEYAVTDLSGYKKAISTIVPTMTPYKKDYHDCDDFADYLKGRVANDYGINGCLRATGRSNTGAAHAFNVVIYMDEGVLKWAVVEPQTGAFVDNYDVQAIRG